MKNRGLLTERDREIVRGEADVEDRANRLSTIRGNVRERAEHMAEDIEILRENGEEELAKEVLDEFDRLRRVESDLEEIKERLENLEGVD